jgi:CRP-like cAMP-binding protein
MDPAAGMLPAASGSQQPGVVRGNDLLNVLSTEGLARVLSESDLTCVSVEAGIARIGDSIRSVHFPISGYASLMVSGEENACVQVALVGTEGMIGWEILFGVRHYLLDVFVPESFEALTIDVDHFRQRVMDSIEWRRSIDAYLARLFEVAARGSLCSRFHLLEARLARCLLEIQDRHGNTPIRLTQKALSELLGVRRSGVTNAATHLQLEGLIQYRRGEIRVLDRAGLIAAACECYHPNARL